MGYKQTRTHTRRFMGALALVSVSAGAGTGAVQAAPADLTSPQALQATAPAQSAVPQNSRQQLSGHLTPDMLQAQLVGRVPATTQLTLTVGLAIQDMAALTDTAERIADPSSDSYGKYLTPEQFADSFGVSADDYQKLLDWGRSNNLTVTAHRNRFVATMSGAAADIETALNIHLNYRLRADGTQFFAPDAEPSINLALPVEHIGGLQDFVPPRNSGGSGVGGTYQGTDFRNAYAPTMTLTGAGQKIGIFMLDGFAQSDINAYAKLTGKTFLPVEEVPAHTVTTPGREGTLDVDSLLAIAPAAQVVAFVGTNRTDILTSMTDRQDIKQFTSSWFWYDGTTTDTALMLELSTHGQSFFQATGDSGAYPVGTWPTYKSGSLDCRQFPAITLVGGTKLDMSGAGASYGTLETAWSGSSGGIETSVALPSYQSGIAGHNGASTKHRNVPDVSAQAAEGNIVFGGTLQFVDGTSEATPLWAGYMALVNELAASYGNPGAGFANPAMYKIAATKAYDTDFHDVVSGCTPNSKDNNQYCAAQGYDLTTGLGSPKHALIYALSAALAYPLYCQGPLVTKSGSNPTTSFKWASKGAGAASPGPGECAWADRGPRGTEIKAGDSNTIAGDLAAVASLPAGKFAAIGVYNDPHTHDMDATQIVGFVKPPFSPTPSLP
jgi:subtilase family serine protease